ncbi:MAG: VCP-like ATPase [Nitrosopumilus sp.]|nr:VCP-like ATPase [Nitrosopumilus sp.]
MILISRKVESSYTRDVGRGVVRIDYNSMDELNVETGDVLEIKGKRRTVAKCLPLYPSDEGKGIIRIDGNGRNNIGVEEGNSISITKSSTVVAQKVTVTSLGGHKPETTSHPPIDEKYLTDALHLVPFTKGDNLMVPYYGDSIIYQVVNVEPDSNVEVRKNTVFTIIE